MRLTVILPLLLAACASSKPTTYERGTYRPPAPATTRPGVGLPQPHMPGQHVGPRVEPNPRPTRRLPPTPGGGPGIWASEAPPSASDTDAPGVLLGQWLPRPDVDDPHKDDLPKFCAALMAKAYAMAEAKGVTTNDKRLRRCVVADLYAACLEHFANKDHALYDATLSSANVFVSKACVGLETSVARDGIVSTVVGWAERLMRVEAQ